MTVLASLLATLAACTNTQSAPNMVDYSYVPATHVIAAGTPTVVTPMGIQDY